MRITRRHQRARRGGAVIEMALATPLLLTLILGQIEVMRLGMVAQLLTNAAREACRVAVLGTSTPDQVRARVAAYLAGSGIDLGTAGTIAITPTNIQATRLGDPIRVDLSVPYNRVSWLPTAGILGNPTLRATATMSSERP